MTTINTRIDTIINAAAEIFRVTPQEILGPSRRQCVFHARMAAIHVIHSYYLMNRFSLSAHFGRTDSWGRWATETGIPSLKTDRKFCERLRALVSKLEDKRS